MKVETWLPVFPGFYNTIFESNEEPEIDDINSQRKELKLPEISYDDCEWDYSEYRDRIAEASCEAIEEKLKESLPNQENLSITFQKVSSPREYNFANDSIHIEVEIDIDDLMDYLLDSTTMIEFEGYIYEEYKSRSGFIPHYSNDHKDWFRMLRNGEKYEHIIGQILEFVLLENYDQFELASDIGVNMYISATNYEELITAK